MMSNEFRLTLLVFREMNRCYIDERSKQSYTYSKIEKGARKNNRSLQRNMADYLEPSNSSAWDGCPIKMINLNQPLINRNGYSYLNQSVEGDKLMINSRFSPTNNGRFGYVNGEVKRTNSSIKINPESNDVVMPLQSTVKQQKVKAGRMWSTLNNFYKKSHIWNKSTKHPSKQVYGQNSDYTSNEKVAINERKRLKKVNCVLLILFKIIESSLNLCFIVSDNFTSIHARRIFFSKQKW